MSVVAPLPFKTSLMTLAAIVAYAGIAADAVPKQSRAELSRRLEQAAELAAGGDGHAASAIYTQATIDNADSAEAWAALGEHLRFYAHDGKAAAAAFEKALASPQKDANAKAFAWRGLGELASSAQQDELAIDYFKKSLAALPLADTHRSLCHLYCRQRNFGAAAQQAQEAVKLNPSDPIALLLYAAQLHRAGEPAEGRRRFEQALLIGGLNARDNVVAPASLPVAPVHCCVVYNAAGYLAVCGDGDAALAMLKRFFQTPNHRHLSRTEIESDADFESLKNNPAFSKLLDSHLPESIPLK